MVKLLFLLLILVRSSWTQTRYITTIYPFQEIINPIIHGSAEIYTLLPPGASPHNYEVRPSDMKNMESAKALFMGGAHLDSWAYKFKNIRTIELIGLLPKQYLLFFNQNSSSLELNESHQRDTLKEIDPHFWTDPLAVKALLPALTDTLCALDALNSPNYIKNATKFSLELDNINLQIEKKLHHLRGKAVLLSHPFFRYYLKRFGIEIVGIIEVIPGTEPTARELKELIQTIKKKNVMAILTHPQLSDRPARLVAEATGIKVFELDPIGGSSGRTTYEEIMYYNTQILLEALQ